jgi:hypothetical protein
VFIDNLGISPQRHKGRNAKEMQTALQQQLHSQAANDGIKKKWSE